MDAPALHRTLIVANRTASTPLLLEEVQRRAVARPTAFALLVPNVSSRKAADWTLETALTSVRGSDMVRGRRVRGARGRFVDHRRGGWKTRVPKRVPGT